MKELISVVVPCYNEEEVLGMYYQEFRKIVGLMGEVNFELILVDDGSKDSTYEIMIQLAAMDSNVRYISFSRNFGKEAAMYAGMKAAKGDYVVIMDADLQDPPSLLPDMYHVVKEEGYDSVATRRVSRDGEPMIRSFFARAFYRLMNHISSADIVDGARDYRLMSRKFVDAILSLSEYNRFSKGLFGWVGFKTKWLEYKNVERAAGETKWSFWKLFRYSLEGIVAFSTLPLSISSFMGVLMCFVSMLFIVFIIIRQIFFGGSVSGWPSMVCIMMFIGGIQLLGIGILGLYLAKTYLEVKKRPIFISQDSNITNFKSDIENRV